MQILDRYFSIAERGSTVSTEIRAGIATFLTLAYILAVNPDILSQAGIPVEDAFVATAVASAIATLIMGLWANFPFALAPGMGLNAYFAFGVVLGLGVAWPVALAAIFVEGLLFIALAWGGIRTRIIDAIPLPIKQGTMVGIGLFLALIGLKNAGVVIPHPETLVTLGVHQAGATAALALGGVVFMAALLVLRIPGAILIGVALIALVAWFTELAPPPESLLVWPTLPRETFLALDFSDALSGAFITVVLAFLFVDLFDTAGTLLGVGHRAGFVDDRGRLPGSDRAFMADAVGTSSGALLGTSTVTTYIESAAGIEEGGRTGLTAVVVAILFLLALFLGDVFVAIPAFATAPALIVVGALMVGACREIDFSRLEESLPAFLAMVVMPFTFSIANGISAAIVSYAVIHLLTGKVRQVHPILWVLAVAVSAYHLFLRGE